MSESVHNAFQPASHDAADARPRATFPPGRRVRVVAVAASMGGVRAVAELLGGLPADFPAPVLVVQHRAPDSATYLDRILARRTALAVGEAAEGAHVRPGRVYVCPPDRHVAVDGDGVIRPHDGPAARHVRASADPLFRSAAEAFGPAAVGVVMTGRGEDGASGAAEIRRQGGVVMVQDPATCEAPWMPRAVLSAGGADFVLSPRALAHALVCLAMAPSVSAALFGIAVPIATG